MPTRLPAKVRKLIGDPSNALLFSIASIGEVAIKRGLRRTDFRVDPRLLRRGLLENGDLELLITGEYGVAVDSLPPRYRDPFDRLPGTHRAPRRRAQKSTSGRGVTTSMHGPPTADPTASVVTSSLCAGGTGAAVRRSVRSAPGPFTLARE
jgi:PIN domain nuclease of toxin-antitoxin system